MPEDKPHAESPFKWESTQPTVRDGGWGWMVVLGSGITNLLLGGLIRSYGLILVVVRERFETSTTAAAWVGGLYLCVNCGTSPVVTALTSRFSDRSVVFIGGLLTGLSCLLTVFAPTIGTMFLFYGVLGGFGAALVYVPAMVIVTQYFEKHRSLALAISTSAAGVGAFVMPLLIEGLLQSWGFFGCFLILAPIMLNNCVSGLLYRPLPSQIQSVVMVTHDAKDVDRTEDFAIKSGEDTNKHSVFVEKVTECPYESRPTNIRISAEHNRPVENTDKTSTCSTISEHHVSLVNGYPEQHPLARGFHYQDSGRCTSQDTSGDLELSPELIDSTPMLQGHLVPDKTSRPRSPPRRLLNLSLWRNPTYVSFILGYSLYVLSYSTFTMMLADYCLHRGMTSSQAAFVLSLIGITDAISRLATGFVFDWSLVRPHRVLIFIATIFVLSLTEFMTCVWYSYAALVLASGLTGVLCGIMNSQVSVVAADLFGIDNLSTTLGQLLFVEGVSMFIGPLVAGYIYDTSGSYVASYLFLGSCCLLAVVLIFVDFIRIHPRCFLERATSEKDVTPMATDKVEPPKV